MNRIEFARVTTRITPVLALALLAGGCAATAPHPFNSADVDQLPLLVRFDDSNCPRDVKEMANSCTSFGPAAAASDVVCRNRKSPIIWLAVKGDQPPYTYDPARSFRIAAKKDRSKPFPPVEKPNGKECEESVGGLLTCRIKATAGWREYWYSVVSEGCPELDPRVYVH